ncbi:DUF6115 domain-containing protein [Alkalicoccus urumqiensis]|uniref:Swarming motility protein SwrB n=1 Tax=Alkalicoccus urumqiensis TaxID=1548213 RepID=A0A2P6MFZ7_ALKUR|nr:hypothetical protein [Alkalicoccus urumqiensis]PRO65204.1 hypothetical protein C6I21_10380 [Alkalicoccus urumqiensis]
MYILLAASLLMHLFTIYAIVVLFRRDSAQNNGDLERSKKEIEDLLEAYTEEMKEENERLVKTLERRSAQSENRTVDTNAAPEHTYSYNHKEPAAEEKPYLPPLPVEEEPSGTYETSTKAKVYQLQDQGYSIEETAKKLKMGAGEVELLVKFRS